MFMAHDEHGINVMKMTIPPKTVCRLNAFLTKTPTTFFRDRKKILKFLWKQKGSSITKAIFSKKRIMLEVLLFQNSRHIREL